MGGTKKKRDKVLNINIDGIDLRVNGQMIEDMRFVYLIGKVSDETITDTERIRYYVLMIETIFIDEVYDIMDKLAEKAGGVLTPDEFADFFGKVLEEVGAKN